MTISLKNRLALTYALFISLALALLSFIINISTGLIFTALIKDNIAGKSEEIARAMAGQYKPGSRNFDAPSVEAMGMYFVHQGYIVTLEDGDGNPVWDARSCDMKQCTEVLNGIAERMEGRFRLNGAAQSRQYPVRYSGKTVGTVTIETYGPFFYSETETNFLNAVNRLLLVTGIVLTLFSIGISMALARAIARPINKAAGAARRIAKLHSGDMNHPGPGIRIDDRYKTRELAELSRSINELAGELEEGERRQRQLSSDIAHELRTPLTCLQGDIEAMIDGVYKPDRERLESCHEEIIRLTGMVRDLNTLTNLEWETMALNKTGFDLAKLLRITAEQFRTAAAEKGIEINLNLRESPVTADYDRLKQVFINLLSNAVKYTDRGSITVTVTEGEGKSSPRREVSIADTGIGIPEKDLPHIFERLYRSDKSRSRSTGGAGIGLTIAAAIIRAHGGTISAENRSESGAGSVFRVSL
ncbi:MAG: HAMP domain-containing protein [Treponema sp.]|jgi:signal transduction histidine kinase|nr:HAMP domain-containing protein [Treponema sp.]